MYCSYYRDGLKTIEEYRCYMDSLIGRLSEIRQSQDKERRRLYQLEAQIRESPHFRTAEHNEKPKSAQNAQPGADHKAIGAATASESPSCESKAESSISGVLWKRSAHKLHKHWQKRKCEVQHGFFYLTHSDVS